MIAGLHYEVRQGKEGRGELPRDVAQQMLLANQESRPSGTLSVFFRGSLSRLIP